MVLNPVEKKKDLFDVVFVPQWSNFLFKSYWMISENLLEMKIIIGKYN